MEALGARRAAPCLRGSTLELAGEGNYHVDRAWYDIDLRKTRAIDDGLDLALVSLSSPLGIESLAPDEAGSCSAPTTTGSTHSRRRSGAGRRRA